VKRGPGELPSQGSVFHVLLGAFILVEWLQFRYGVRWIWRGIWRGPWIEAAMVVAALFFGTRQAAQAFIYFAF